MGFPPPTPFLLFSFADMLQNPKLQTFFAETQHAFAGPPGAGQPLLVQSCMLHVARCLALVHATQGAGGGDIHTGTNLSTMFALPCGGPEMPPQALLAVQGEQGESSAVSPQTSAYYNRVRGKTVLFEACLGFVSKDDYPEPFIATVWDSLPGPAPILQGIFQKAKAVLCNCTGTLPAEVKGEKGVFLL